MGASVYQLVQLLSKDFLILVAIAAVAGIPVGYYLMNRWLEGFAYKTSLDVIAFLVAGAVSLVIAFVTVSVEAFKAAAANPVKSLRSE
jgi:putative ABC transport system permease protein